MSNKDAIFEYEGVNNDQDVDFVITSLNNCFIADFFDKNIDDNNEAHLSSLNLNSLNLNDAIEEAKNYTIN